MNSSVRPIRVLFLLQRPEAWGNIASIWQAMSSRAVFQPSIWLLPYNVRDVKLSALHMESHRKLLTSQNIPFKEWKTGEVLRSDLFDVAFFTHPYDRERPRELWFDRVRVCVDKIVYVPYGLSVGAGTKNLLFQYGQPLQRGADLIIVRSEAEKAMYAQYCPAGDHHVQVLGHPRIDYLIKNLGEARSIELEERIGGRLTVLWNSHFSFGHTYSQSSNFSTFDLIGPELLDYFVKHGRTHCLLWRPHPGLFPELVRQNLLSQEQIPALRKELDMLGVVLDERRSHLPAFFYSHALISDPGTFLFEYLAMAKPLLPLINPEGERLNAEATELVKNCSFATSFSDVEVFIENISQCQINYKKYYNLQQRYLPVFSGGVGDRICEFLLGNEVPLRASKILSPPLNVYTKRNISIQGDVPQQSQFPTLHQLQTSLRQIRTEKAAKSWVSKRAKRYGNQIRTIAVEFIKQHPPLLHVTNIWQKKYARKES